MRGQRRQGAPSIAPLSSAAGRRYDPIVEPGQESATLWPAFVLPPAALVNAKRLGAWLVAQSGVAKGTAVLRGQP
jgi:hypothetical protein